MAESVDALVSNTNVSNDVPVRPRLRVPKDLSDNENIRQVLSLISGHGKPIYFEKAEREWKAGNTSFHPRSAL